MRARLAATLLALAALSCAPALWHRSASVEVGGARARLFVPRVFEPLLPGSIYPDRSRPIAPRGLPAVLAVVRRVPPRALAEPLGRRGVVALVGREMEIPEGLAALRAHPAAGGRVGLIVEAPAERTLAAALARREIAAIVVLGEPPSLPPSGPPLLALRAGVPAGHAPAGAAERWYASPDGRLPEAALGDAADWLAETLRPGPR